MAVDGSDQVTQLLKRWSGGDEAARDEVTELVYPELRRIAEAYLRRERDGHTLQPTALIHEAYLRLVQVDHSSFDSRKQFYGLAAHLMRQILVDHARHANAAKRGGGSLKQVGLDAAAYKPDDAAEFLTLNQALTELARFSPRKAQILELRYFGGLGLVEVGDLLGVSAATVSREQRLAEAWLTQSLSGG